MMFIAKIFGIALLMMLSIAVFGMFMVLGFISAFTKFSIFYYITPFMGAIASVMCIRLAYRITQSIK